MLARIQADEKGYSIWVPQHKVNEHEVNKPIHHAIGYCASIMNSLCANEEIGFEIRSVSFLSPTCYQLSHF